MNKTIFVQIAAYRDPELLNTLDDLISNAKYPKNLRICIAWQHSEEEEWDNLDKYKNDDRFNILDFDYRDSKGTCWARHQIQQQYNGEDYTLQLDSHHRFIKHWDYELLKMYKNLQKKGHKKPLITGYLPSYFPEKDPQNRTQEVWKMDFNRFTPEGYIFTYPSLIENWKELKEPVLARFYSAHFAFTTGKFCVEVPHDPNMYFHGEEPSIAVRAYTHGYDLFHPHIIIGWHEYTRNGKPRHWDDFPNDWKEIDDRSHARYRLLHGMDGESCGGCSKRKIQAEFNFGNERTLMDYEMFAGVRFRDRRIQQHTLDLKLPPNPKFHYSAEYEESLLYVFKHCLDIHKDHFNEDDYDLWAISFELNDGTVCQRLDAEEDEIKRLLNESKKDDWVRIWRDYQGIKPEKWVIWPHSKSKGWVERYEQQI